MLRNKQGSFFDLKTDFIINMLYNAQKKLYIFQEF